MMMTTVPRPMIRAMIRLILIPFTLLKIEFICFLFFIISPNATAKLSARLKFGDGEIDHKHGLALQGLILNGIRRVLQQDDNNLIQEDRSIFRLDLFQGTGQLLVELLLNFIMLFVTGRRNAKMLFKRF